MALRSIPDGHVARVCQPGTYQTCRYLCMGSTGWECIKSDPGFKQLIDDRVEAGQMNATKDNCDGDKDIPVWREDA